MVELKLNHRKLMQYKDINSLSNAHCSLFEIKINYDKINISERQKRDITNDINRRVSA